MKHGAILVKGGAVQSMGVNTQKNHPTIVDAENTPWHCGDHAEIAALKRASVTAGGTLYVARVRFDGSWAMSKPCRNCQQAIDAAQIKRVVWSYDD